jgi:hypothetical protein
MIVNPGDMMASEYEITRNKLCLSLVPSFCLLEMPDTFVEGLLTICALSPLHSSSASSTSLAPGPSYWTYIMVSKYVLVGGLCLVPG